MSVKLSISADTSAAERAFSSQRRDRAQRALANQMLADMNQYVPKKESPLRTTGHVSDDNELLIWDTPYAAKQYYIQHSNYTTPGTGPRWDEKAKGIHRNDWLKVYVDGLGV